MPSSYYETSVRIGKEFQKNNPKNWSGHDCKNYHNQIRFLMDKYDAKTVLDYGCGKGQQYTELLEYGISETETSEPMTFKERINAQSVYLYDPCVEGLDILPEYNIKFDAVICTQVLGSVPDEDIKWVKESLMRSTGKFCFIGLMDPSIHVKTKKRLYDTNYVSLDRTIEWYKEQFADWTGSNLYWWFRYSQTDLNSWYTM